MTTYKVTPFLFLRFNNAMCLSGNDVLEIRAPMVVVCMTLLIIRDELIYFFGAWISLWLVSSRDQPVELTTLNKCNIGA